MFNLFNKKRYLDCHEMKHSLHFFYDEIRACCSNIPGPIFYSDYCGENVDWEYIYKIRNNYKKAINSVFSKKMYPVCCEGCCELNSNIKDAPINKFDNVIDKIYFHNYMACNAKCTYCTYEYIERGYKYKVLPLVKDIISKKILSKNAHIYMSGGEITISDEFEELLSTLQNYLNSKIEILTSGIKYCKSIEEAFVNNKCRLVISLDSSNTQTYEKIKRVNCFDRVVNNIKTYVNASDNAKKDILLKYIIVDNVNDNREEIAGFVELAKSLCIENVRLDFDYEKYKYTKDIKVPELYFDLYEYFDTLAKKCGLKVQTCSQVEAILNKSR